MRIRKYMVIGVLSIVIFPWFVYFFAHYVDTRSWAPWSLPNSQQRQMELTQTIDMLAKNASNWSNPTWQHHLQEQLDKDKMGVVIQSPSNRVIFDTQQTNHHHWMADQQTTVISNGRLVGTIQLYMSQHEDPGSAIAALIAMIFAISFVGFQIGRNVVRPLESMSRAALQIAEGDLDFQLSSSAVKEISQVRSAFHVMVDGLRESFAKQSKLEEERRFFIGAIAHDLRTPLFSLRGYLDGLEQGVAASPEKISKYVAVCKQKAAHLDRLVSDLFAFTRLEYMEQTLRQEHFDLSNLVKRCSESMRSSAKSREIRIRVDILADHLCITGDEHLLERALTNLLDNALRYTPRGGEVRVQLSDDARRIVIRIQDTGIGFSAYDLEHIFDPMYRGDVSRNVATGGAGLGLTIARRVFQAHGGDLTASNGADAGAVLTGWFPKDTSVASPEVDPPHK